MTPKEKALQLRDKFYKCPEVQETESKRCALICVDEIIQTYHSPMDDEQIQEWQEVRLEIEKL